MSATIIFPNPVNYQVHFKTKEEVEKFNEITIKLKISGVIEKFLKDQAGLVRVNYRSSTLLYTAQEYQSIQQELLSPSTQPKNPFTKEQINQIIAILKNDRMHKLNGTSKDFDVSKFVKECHAIFEYYSVSDSLRNPTLKQRYERFKRLAFQFFIDLKVKVPAEVYKFNSNS